MGIKVKQTQRTSELLLRAHASYNTYPMALPSRTSVIVCVLENRYVYAVYVVQLRG